LILAQSKIDQHLDPGDALERETWIMSKPVSPVQDEYESFLPATVEQNIDVKKQTIESVLPTKEEIPRRRSSTVSDKVTTHRKDVSTEEVS